MDESTLEKPKSRIDRPASHDPAAPSIWHTLRHALFAWARHTFSVSAIINGLKSLLWVAPLSVIIWIYADRQVKPDPESVTMFIAVTSSDPSRVVRLIEPSNRKVRAELDGPNGSLGPMVRLLESGAVVELEVPEDTLKTDGNHQIQSSLLNELPFFKDKGISITSIDPADLTINVDEFLDKDIEIQAAPGRSTYASPPIFEPRKVHVHGPKSVLQSDNFAVYAHLDQAKETLTSGTQDLTGVPLSLAGHEENVTINPQFVSAHVEIKKSDVPGKIDSIPVWAIYPPTVEDRYKATYDPSIPDVIVSGPEDQIRALTNHTYTISPKAFFEVTDNPSPGVSYSAKLRFELPPNVPDVHVSPEFAQKTITYTLSDRKSSE